MLERPLRFQRVTLVTERKVCPIGALLFTITERMILINNNNDNNNNNNNNYNNNNNFEL